MLGLMGFSGSLPCMLFIDIISLFINWANKDACLYLVLTVAITKTMIDDLIRGSHRTC